VGVARDGHSHHRVSFSATTLGVGDLGGCYGSRIRTPTLDRMAAKAPLHHFNSARSGCSPSRAALLTGRSRPTRLGVPRVAESRDTALLNLD